ncbi:hypothetical protein BaRGS_00024389 [Batillaria attramentaria]|uniref:Uncharacterized protein n=1 Tax=Batillaria attramentaria TaxID=370345 RepID=A0ABD0KBC5_9CAEN
MSRSSPVKECCECFCKTGGSCVQVCCSWCSQLGDCLSSEGTSRGDYQQGQADIQIMHSQPASNTIRRSSFTLPAEAEDEEGGTIPERTDGPNLSHLDLEMSNMVDPSAPPNYETVVEDLPTPRQEATAPPLTFHDTASAPSPPSYESLFKDSSKA